jgi:hypothetical protein
MCESRNDGTNGRWPANASTVSPSERPSEIDLSGYVFETLRRDSDFVLLRGTREDSLAPLLLMAPASERPTTRIVARLRRAYAIRAELDSASVAINRSKSGQQIAQRILGVVQHWWPPVRQSPLPNRSHQRHPIVGGRIPTTGRTSGKVVARVWPSWSSPPFWRIESQEGDSCYARTPLNFVRVRCIGDP